VTVDPATCAEPAEISAPSGGLGRWSVSPARAVAIAYVSAVFVTAMDMQIVNVALPTLARAFGAPLSDVQWTVIAYLLTLAVVIPASGWLGDRIGNKRTFVIALAVFTIASALCGFAQSLDELIAARALQGVGGGMLTPMGMAMLYRTFPPARRAAVARTLIVPVLIGPGLAPVLGGVFTEYVSWRWVFFVNVPVGAVMIVFSQLFLNDDRPARSGRLDVRGLVLSGVGLSAFMYAISEGSALGWSSPAILGSGLGGLACLALFTRSSLRGRDPLLRLSLLSDRLFRATNAVVGLALGSFLGSLYLTPIFLQEVQHRSPLQSGLCRPWDGRGPRLPRADRHHDEPLVDPRSDVRRRAVQRGEHDGRPGRHVHPYLEGRHRTRIGDLQHPAPGLDRPRGGDPDHDRRRRRRSAGGRLPGRLRRRRSDRSAGRRRRLDADPHRRRTGDHAPGARDTPGAPVAAATLRPQPRRTHYNSGHGR
jgi:MFS family permease